MLIIIPKDAVLTNETQDEFWIMTITSDSLALKTPIVIGLENDSEVEIVKSITSMGSCEISAFMDWGI